ncbi:alpha/beta hydrolase [Streptomyces sp. NPDC004082]|uniref:alpha/beta hydrolase n=2 Tax=Streptomyces TaxID=1883 RepID=UPI00339EF3BF
MGLEKRSVERAQRRRGGAEYRERVQGKRTRRRGTWQRGLLAALITGALVVPLAAAARPEIPAPDPAVLGQVTAATLDEVFAANRANAAEASRMAAAHGDTHRAAAERSMAGPSRRLLAFDGRGPGRVIEVFGDLARADRIAVLVPGSDTSLDTYTRFRAGALTLRDQLTRETGGSDVVAVVAWLGYRTPGTVSVDVLTDGLAEQSAPHLRVFVGELRDVAGEDVHVALLCHSYGSVVCGRAAPGLEVDDIALLGSPGTGADSAAALRTSARIWAARGAEDWIADVPHVKAGFFGMSVGFGTDPVSPAFGARVFEARGGHSDYFAPGSASLAGLAGITLGRISAVPRA